MKTAAELDARSLCFIPADVRVSHEAALLADDVAASVASGASGARKAGRAAGIHPRRVP